MSSLVTVSSGTGGRKSWGSGARPVSVIVALLLLARTGPDASDSRDTSNVEPLRSRRAGNPCASTPGEAPQRRCDPPGEVALGVVDPCVHERRHLPMARGHPERRFE